MPIKRQRIVGLSNGLENTPLGRQEGPYIIIQNFFKGLITFFLIVFG